ncbi:ADP-ribosylglycohydrolase family protein [uncultured Thiodictyon sp.]|jgi:ADP-ribosylglycohydrolase|uniref:ADP-ribosylglycohydrolase family protein n=1 Tax=uncultured Thiodictyon sp. TaxID=1846217 RepID=UPI0025FB9778|nr:ADP-ribosylglycohydrolase family protein [uncultured Thiodictyon sp.]
MNPTRLDRYRGCLLGLAAGDALGTTLEFRAPGSFEPITGIAGGGPFHLKPGEWTDDTSMALCLAESLVLCRGFDAADQMRRYVRWWREGHLSVTGACFDIGNATRGALGRFEQTGDPFAGATDPRSAGNGCIMRLAPVPMAFAGDPHQAITLAAESSRTTHGARTCLDACRYMAGILVGALNGVDKGTLLGPRYSPVPGLWGREPLCPAIDAVAAGSFKAKEPPAIRGSGYVVEALEAALWAFHRTDSFAAGALAAVNLGDDADTTGAIYGQLAGAWYGLDGIPREWREVVAQAGLILGLAESLSKVIRPAHRAMKDAENLQCVRSEAIGDDVGC